MFQGLARTVEAFETFKGRYWVAGGWAIDLFIGRQTRNHKDIDIAIDRADLPHLEAWEMLESADFLKDGKPHRWDGKTLDTSVHELHCRLKDGQEIEILLNDFTKDEWVYRRNADVTMPLSRFPAAAPPRLPVEIVLLYKSTDPSRKDEKDFEAVLPLIDDEQKKWLKAALAMCNDDHVWVDDLD